MVFRVLDTLNSAREVDRRILCGPPQSIIDQRQDLRDLISPGNIQWIQNQATPATSTYHVLQSLVDDAPVLITTADHALLSAEIVDYFCAQARETGADLAVGLALHETVLADFPNTRRTATKLSDAAYCSCNLFAFLTPRAYQLADMWRRVEQERKKPLRIISVLGWVAVLRYLMGRLTLAEAEKRISRRLRIAAKAVVLPFAEAAVDIDTVDDWENVETIVEKRR
jgi:hypothetical protein